MKYPKTRSLKEVEMFLDRDDLDPKHRKALLKRKAYLLNPQKKLNYYHTKVDKEAHKAMKREQYSRNKAEAQIKYKARYYTKKLLNPSKYKTQLSVVFAEAFNLKPNQVLTIQHKRGSFSSSGFEDIASYIKEHQIVSFVLESLDFQLVVNNKKMISCLAPNYIVREK